VIKFIVLFFQTALCNSTFRLWVFAICFCFSPAL